MDHSLSISPESFTSFGELLRFLRERIDLSQKDLALQVGYHYSYMSRIEKNQRTPDPTTLAARFIPALYLDEEPEWTAQLLKLAGKPAPPKTTKSELKPAALPPPTALPIFDLSASNLPNILTPLLGRDKEVNELTNLLGRNDVRLVTLIGAPGVGKTRLATHVAAQIAGQFAHGPLFVDLTVVADTEAFLPTVAQTLGIRETSDMPLVKNIITTLRQRDLLLILDNFEQVLEASPFILPILSNTTGVKILVTSREALHISGEYEFPLAPLQVPEVKPAAVKTAEQFNDLSHSASVQLFVQRAQAVLPSFELTPENVSDVNEICRHLDGLPLAIELAAARIKTLAPQTMLQQLDRRLDWLTHGSRNAGSWKQTLRGTLEWSYNLMLEPEQILFRRLSVFSGGWTLRSAEVVCADLAVAGTESNLRVEDVLDTLIKLVDKSIVVTENTTQQARYHLLETMREFGREKLVQTGELTEILNRHLAHFTEYAEEAESHLDGSDQATWVAISEKEHNNFRAAIDHAFTPGADLTLGLRIGAAISLYWLERNHYHEGIERLKKLIHHATGPEHNKVRAKMLYRCAAIHTRISDYTSAYNLCRQSVEVARTVDVPWTLASALYYFGEICINIQDLAQARVALEESVAICWSSHFSTQLNMALTNLGWVLYKQGELSQALSTLQEAFAIAERIDDEWGIVHASHRLGMVNRHIGEQATAIDFFQRSLPVARSLGDRFALGVALSNLSVLYYLKGQYQPSGQFAEQAFIAFQDIGAELEQPLVLRMMGYSAIHARNTSRARTLIIESLKASRELADLAGQLACLVGLAAREFEEGNTVKAINFAALAEKLLEENSLALMEPDAMALSHILQSGQKELGKKPHAQAVANGRVLLFENVIADELKSVT